ncbi:uncharacterized protein ACOB8E_001758 [Sarcophilus harrisii]
MQISAQHYSITIICKIFFSYSSIYGHPLHVQISGTIKRIAKENENRFPFYFFLLSTSTSTKCFIFFPWVHFSGTSLGLTDEETPITNTKTENDHSQFTTLQASSRN